MTKASAAFVEAVGPVHDHPDARLSASWRALLSPSRMAAKMPIRCSLAEPNIGDAALETGPGGRVSTRTPQVVVHDDHLLGRPAERLCLGSQLLRRKFDTTRNNDDFAQRSSRASNNVRTLAPPTSSRQQIPPCSKDTRQLRATRPYASRVAGAKPRSSISASHAASNPANSSDTGRGPPTPRVLTGQPPRCTPRSRTD